jgi:hypothetical protein
MSAPTTGVSVCSTLAAPDRSASIDFSRLCLRSRLTNTIKAMHRPAPSRMAEKASHPAVELAAAPEVGTGWVVVDTTVDELDLDPATAASGNRRTGTAIKMLARAVRPKATGTRFLLTNTAFA